MTQRDGAGLELLKVAEITALLIVLLLLLLPLELEYVGLAIHLAYVKFPILMTSLE